MGPMEGLCERVRTGLPEDLGLCQETWEGFKEAGVCSALSDVRNKLVTAMTPVGTAVSVLCVTTLYVNLPTRYSALTPETFTSVCHHTADPLCLAEPLSVSPPVASALFSVAVCLLSAGLICSFIYCFAFSMPCISGVTCYVSLSV